MNMRRTVFIICLLVLGWTALTPVRVLAIPGKITLTGSIQDSDGKPLEYWEWVTHIDSTTLNQYQVYESLDKTVDSRLCFYKSATIPTAILDVATTAVVGHGHFTIMYAVPDELLTQGAMWYSLAIDADRNGLDDGDLFPDRFELTSVPFALSAKPVDFFVAPGGVTPIDHSIRSVSLPPNFPSKNAMVVAPFTTPPGGVRFNQMSAYFVEVDPGFNFSYGIYDQAGKLVTTSGLIKVGDKIISGAFLRIDLPTTVTLAPSSMYFTAMTYTPLTATWGFMVRLTSVPSIPLTGVVAIDDTANGLLPDTFDWKKITTKYEAIPLSITLTHDSELAPKASLSGTAGLSGTARLTWIPAKPTYKLPVTSESEPTTGSH